jgi:cholesterol transport system auxiliary component
MSFTLLAGCVSLGGKPPALLLGLTSQATVPANTERTAADGQAVAVLVPSTPTAIGGIRVAVQTGPTSIEYVKDAAWADVPARLFRNLLAETVSAKTGRVVLDLREYSITPGTTLSGRLTMFGYDVASRSSVVSYDAVVKRGDAQQIATRRFEAKVPSGDSAAEIGAALNRAANQVASDVADWVK